MSMIDSGGFFTGSASPRRSTSTLGASVLTGVG